MMISHPSQLLLTEEKEMLLCFSIYFCLIKETQKEILKLKVIAELLRILLQISEHC